ncbi:RluA family pseudouridine synthase [uncultured Desulfobacter sp.]|uniref:RluA family pseudouridine synthase n=1 Tax=uncultured Desulfobacter sp. TaxID=240139 RepID=UPI0029F54148|nr:RluA family pseudouridine synthase [uncultured Desulfobacter sp.]
MKEKIRIIEHGQGWICLEKPGGMSVHNDPGKDMISILQKSLGRGSVEKLQPAHRLDKETSGLLLVATTQETLTDLSALFAARKVTKRYKALVHGHFDQDRGSWDTPLTKSAGGRTDPRGRGKRVKALTGYTVLDRSIHYTLLDIELFTGRKHQIRRHAKLAGHPVVGDPRYGSPRALEFLKNQKQFESMGLQSYFLKFQDKGRTITLELPDLPLEAARLFEEDKS